MNITVCTQEMRARPQLFPPVYVCWTTALAARVSGETPARGVGQETARLASFASSVAGLLGRR
eukprot:9451042-Lingulodinium_polyedra.AAC.1